jgi:hypothetical protein
MKHRFVRYLHSSKESNNDIVNHFGNNDLKSVGYEEELVYEYDDKTNKSKLIGANGFFLSDEKISPSELEEIPEEEEIWDGHQGRI